MEHLPVVKRGFTLPEVLVVAVIIILIIAGSFSVYLLCYSTWRNAIVWASVQRNGSIAMERLVRGMKAPTENKKNGLREAKDFTIYDSDSIKFTSGVDNKDRYFYFEDEDNTIIYDPNKSMVDDEIVVAKDVESLSFERLSNKRLRISLSLYKKIGDKPINMDLKTEVTIRN